MPRLSKIGAAALAAFGWTSGASVTANYLVVAGGASGGGGTPGNHGGGGGGAGGYRTSTASLNTGLSYTVTVGAGGAGGSTTGVSGGDSIFNVTTSSGGGGGGANPGTITSVGIGVAGGSGGGGSADGLTNVGTAGGAGNTPSTSPAQGFAGGQGLTDNASYSAAGGGGGSSAVGAGGVNGQSGAGGAGTANSITGSSVTYAGGGGGGRTDQSAAGAGGSGGGGAGGTLAGNGNPGTANLGGGGGGAGRGTQTGGNGGSGVVIISYPAPQQFGGGVVTTSGSNVIHTFNTSGTLSPLSSLTASYLIVAGGGAGGGYRGGGGGAGGLLSGSGLTIDTNSNYLITVGAGGVGNTTTTGGSGTNSAFSMVTTTAVAGGGGGSNFGGSGIGATGGSGGGGTGNGGLPAGGTGTSGQGFAGGAGGGGTYNGGGGGGGASAVGVNGTTAGGGNGGAGTASSISGSSVTYAGGGGGGCIDGGGVAGTGGAGGGGAGTAGNTTGNAGTANTGGGGGGAGQTGGSFTTAGGAGGSGVVIISYAGATQQMAGGTVTITGGNVIHTFNSSGYLTPIKLVNNSLRFRSSASAYLNRTLTTPTNNKIWTWSSWVKRGTLGSAQVLLSSDVGTSNTTWLEFGFDAADTFTITAYTTDSNTTSAVFRDPAAWYHVIVAFDSTQATAANRCKIYFNGVQQTLTGAGFTLNAGYGINSAQITGIGYRNWASGVGRYFDGYLTEVNFVDGQQLTPNSFGTFNSYGVWQPITYGGSYGTNGFYLPFNANALSYAGSFNGSNQYLSSTVGTSTIGSGDFTVEFYINSTSGTDARMFSLGNNNATGSLHIIYTGTYMRVNWATTGGATGTRQVSGGGWHHYALVRSSNTLKSYVDGILDVNYGTVTDNFNLTALQVGANSALPSYFSGYLSNFRITTSALYTANFVPSTTALTAVSGTTYLTLQNATIVDNSTNAYTITNNGTVITGQTYPLAYNIFSDQSSAGNNWTPNNISGLSGTTLDYMTDVPTLTSATAANYAVLNPLAMYGTSAVISNANLTSSATGGPSNRGWPSSIAAPGSGKWYAEFTFTATDSGNNGGCGIMLENGTGSPGESATTVVWLDAATIRQNASGTSYGTALSVNDVVIVAYDAGLGRVWFGKQGTWFASGDPSTNANPSATGITTTGRFATYHFNTSATIQANFGQRPFTYTPPTNFVALNTYNL